MNFKSTCRMATAIGVCLMAIGLIAITPANAGEQTGTVGAVIVRDSDGLIYFWMTGSHDGRPACAANHTYWMIANENSETGKRQFAMLMLAKAQGLTIQVSGKNTCVRWGDGEDVNAIVLLQ